MKKQIKHFALLAFTILGFNQIVTGQCTNNCGVDAGLNKTSTCPGNQVLLGVTGCVTGGAGGCTYTINWTPSNLVVSGQGTCKPIVNPSVTTKFYMNVWMKGNCCCAGASGSCATSSCDSILKRDSVTVTVNNTQCARLQSMGSEIDNASIKIDPNPTSGKLNVEFLEDYFSNANFSGIPVIALYDYNGRIVANKEVTERSSEMDFSHLPKGMYFLRITDEKSTLCVKKIILN